MWEFPTFKAEDIYIEHMFQDQRPYYYTGRADIKAKKKRECKVRVRGFCLVS